MQLKSARISGLLLIIIIIIIHLINQYSYYDLVNAAEERPDFCVGDSHLAKPLHRPITVWTDALETLYLNASIYIRLHLSLSLSLSLALSLSLYNIYIYVYIYIYIYIYTIRHRTVRRRRLNSCKSMRPSEAI